MAKRLRRQIPAAEIRQSSAEVTAGRCPNDGRKMLRWKSGDAICPRCAFRVIAVAPPAVDPRVPFHRHWTPKVNAKPKRRDAW